MAPPRFLITALKRYRVFPGTACWSTYTGATFTGFDQAVGSSRTRSGLSDGGAAEAGDAAAANATTLMMMAPNAPLILFATGSSLPPRLCPARVAPAPQPVKQAA